MREIAFNLIYVSAVLMLGVLGMTLYSFQQAETIRSSSWLAQDGYRNHRQAPVTRIYSEEKRGESRNSG